MNIRNIWNPGFSWAQILIDYNSVAANLAMNGLNLFIYFCIHCIMTKRTVIFHSPTYTQTAHTVLLLATKSTWRCSFTRILGIGSNREEDSKTLYKSFTLYDLCHNLRSTGVIRMLEQIYWPANYFGCLSMAINTSVVDWISGHVAIFYWQMMHVE